MTIYDELKALYDRPCVREAGRTLEGDLAYYIQRGYVFSGPGYFIMGEQIDQGWYVQVAVGPGAIAKFVELMPHYLPWVGWRREKFENQVKWHPTDAVIRKVKQYARSTISAEAASTTNEG